MLFLNGTIYYYLLEQLQQLQLAGIFWNRADDRQEMKITLSRLQTESPSPKRESDAERTESQVPVRRGIGKMLRGRDDLLKTSGKFSCYKGIKNE